MTFDEFKIHFEKFSSIDSAEKLAICQQQYQQHLLHIEDQQTFEPVEYKTGDDRHSQYLADTEKVLLNNHETGCYYAYLVRPSFEPEYGLSIRFQNDQYELTHTILEKNYWGVSNDPHNLNKIIKRCCSTQHLKKSTGDKLFLLLNKSISTARKRQSKMITLDGTLYTICKYNTGEAIRVSKHSPIPDSVTGKIIEIMEQLIQLTEKAEQDSVSLEMEIDSLLKTIF